jgi:hypothetical protein
VELNGYLETILHRSRRRTEPEWLQALQEEINFNYLTDDALEGVSRLKNHLLVAHEFELLAPNIDGTRMKKAWRVVQTCEANKTAHLRALNAMTRRAAALGSESWLARLAPVLIRALDEHHQVSVVHLGDTGLQAPSREERVCWESVSHETAQVIRDLVPQIQQPLTFLHIALANRHALGVLSIHKKYLQASLCLHAHAVW